MGTSGSGRLTDYPKSPKPTGGSGGGRPGNPSDRCEQAFSVTLEDVEHYDFFKNHGGPPPVGTELQIAHKKRIVAQTTSGEIVGGLPTSFNYLAACLKSGFKYVGQVRRSAKAPRTTVVAADFTALPP